MPLRHLGYIEREYKSSLRNISFHRSQRGSHDNTASILLPAHSRNGVNNYVATSNNDNKFPRRNSTKHKQSNDISSLEAEMNNTEEQRLPTEQQMEATDEHRELSQATGEGQISPCKQKYNITNLEEFPEQQQDPEK